jgi:hypothetical protein
VAVDDESGAAERGVAAFAAVPDAFQAAHGRTGVLRVASTADRPFDGVPNCPAAILSAPRVGLDVLTTGALHSWHSRDEPCPQCEGRTANPRCDGYLCGARAMRARMGMAEGRVE